MYSESFTISEFTSRLSKTTLSSFEEVLELVNDYEVGFPSLHLITRLSVNNVQMKSTSFSLMIVKTMH